MMEKTPFAVHMRWVATLALAALAAGFAPMSTAADAGRQVQINDRGLTLNGWLTETESPVATVLMLHGTLAHANMEIMATLAEVMAENGIESLRISLSLDQDDRMGMFDCQSPHRHKHGDAVPELAAWIRWLAENGRQDIVLLGHSRGTNQVARFAAGTPGAVSALVLVAPAVYRPGPSNLSPGQVEALERARTLVAAGQGGTLMTGVDVLHCPGADITADSFLSYYDEDPGFDTLALAAASGLPALVVVGSEDPLSAGVREAMATSASGGSMSLLVVDGADHFFRDLYAYDLVEGMRAWLEATTQVQP